MSETKPRRAEAAATFGVFVIGILLFFGGFYAAWYWQFHGPIGGYVSIAMIVFGMAFSGMAYADEVSR